jgi:two-component system, NtrC family, response regulator HydG
MENDEPSVSDTQQVTIDADSAAHSAFVVIVEQGPSPGATLRLDGNEGAILVGQSPVCTLRLDDVRVSRRHLSLEVTGGALRLIDLGSTNGTVVGTLRVNDAILTGGENVRVGDSVLSITRIPTRAPAAPPSRTVFGLLVGHSQEMRRLYPWVEKLAASNVPVLIEGETGTGKELLAESLHLEGPRKAGPFVVFDCTAVAPNLVESELFGHERGSFTGATATRKGVFELAEGGTLLIDEIGDLDPSLQPKLLRVLERGEVRRVGGSETIRVDVRVVSATRRDLDREVQAGRFRDDLFHRLVVARIELPPLRRRRGDVPLLARHFAREIGGAEAKVPDALVARWDELTWPGNVRELRNAVSRHLALGDLVYDGDTSETTDEVDSDRSDRVERTDTRLVPEDLSIPIEGMVERVLSSRLPLVQARQRIVEEFDRAYLARVLREHEGNVTRAAAAAGLARRNFQILRGRRNV